MATYTFPPPATSAIDWNNIGFKAQVDTVNGHVECSYNATSQQWSEPEFVEDPFLRVHGMAPGLNYGQQCYEGQKAFRNKNGKITIFRPTMNAQRMQISAASVSMPAIPEETFLLCIRMAVSLNAEFVPPHDTGAAMYIRPLLFGSSAQLGLSPPEEYLFCVYVMPTGVYHGSHPVAGLILEDFDRAAPEGMGSYKVGGNYAPVLRHSEKARQAGYGITLHLDSRTRSEIDEFSTSGFIGVKKSGSSYALVVPDSRQVIKSVTSDSVCELAKSFGWRVEHRSVKYEELRDFAEVMAAGTAAALVPIRSLTMISRGETFQYQDNGDQPGPACVKLLQALQGIQRGLVDDTFGWNEEVHRIEHFKARATSKPSESTNGANTQHIGKLP